MGIGSVLTTLKLEPSMVVAVTHAAAMHRTVSCSVFWVLGGFNSQHIANFHSVCIAQTAWVNFHSHDIANHRLIVLAPKICCPKPAFSQIGFSNTVFSNIVFLCILEARAVIPIAWRSSLASSCCIKQSIGLSGGNGTVHSRIPLWSGYRVSSGVVDH